MTEKSIFTTGFFTLYLQARLDRTSVNTLQNLRCIIKSAKLTRIEKQYLNGVKKKVFLFGRLGNMS